MPDSSAEVIYKARKNLLDMLKERNFDVSAYTGASMNEVNTMFTTKQLDMILHNPETDEKMVIKYHLAKGLRQNNIHEYIEDIFQVEQVLKKSDDLMIIVKDEPNDSLIKVLQNI